MTFNLIIMSFECELLNGKNLSGTCLLNYWFKDEKDALVGKILR